MVQSSLLKRIFKGDKIKHMQIHINLHFVRVLLFSRNCLLELIMCLYSSDSYRLMTTRVTTLVVSCTLREVIPVLNLIQNFQTTQNNGFFFYHLLFPFLLLYFKFDLLSRTSSNTFETISTKQLKFVNIVYNVF